MAEPQKTLPWHVERALELAATDPQLKALMPRSDMTLPYPDPGLTYEGVIEAITNAYADRPAIATRDYELAADPTTGRIGRVLKPSFSAVSYKDLNARIKRLATTWRDDAQHRVAPGDFVCILGFTGLDYAVIDLACAYAQAVSVPLQSTLAGNDLSGIFTDTAPTAIAATITDLALAAELAGAHPSIRSVIAFDYDPGDDDERERFAAAQAELARNGSAARLATVGELIAKSGIEAWSPLPPHPEGAERMATLIHSSGSTGKPKGAIMTERIAKAVWRTQPLSPVVRVALAPMNHFAGRGMIYGTLARGGTAYITARPDLSVLFEDIRLARPTELSVVPRVLEMAHRHYLSEVLRRGGEAADQSVKDQVMAEMRTSYLGDRLVMVNFGSAPTTAEVKQFMSECFQIPMIEGYGQTEAGGGFMSGGRLARPPVTAYRLRDVPALGYYTSDKPYPRGELCVKSELVSPGYFKRPDATAKLFDEDGYLLTGDIMEERGPDQLVYIDRSNDVLKLSQGEFVAVGALGATFESGSQVIQQIYIYGNSARSFLVAVVVPNMQIVRSRLGKEPSEDEVRALVRAEMKKVAITENLRTFEIPRDFIIEYEPFTHENGLLTSVQKRMRPALKARYGERLEQMYLDLERKQNDELRALRDSQGLTVLQKVGKALEAALGIEAIDVDLPYSFGELGGDSLGAAGFTALLDEIFGVDIPVSAIISPAGNAKAWARQIEAALNADPDALSVARIHGEGATELRASDLDVGAFLDAETLSAAPAEPPKGDPSRVLLTGATGFLGRFLCLEWLERLAPRGGKLICLVRAADHATALRRLAAPFSGVDPALEKRFNALAERHLEVVVGDVAEPRLGVGAETFERLADEVDHIVHCGAFVNHVLPYQDLFGPNVVGTAELVRLALTRRQKGFDFISTVGVLGFLQPGKGRNEDTPLLETVKVAGGYAFGYGASKWASETLLHSVHARFGLPVNIFRCDMVLADRRYAGQINVPDSFTRTLHSLIWTELAPASFHELGPDGARQAAHYDGLPVDFIARSIVGIGAGSTPQGVRTFHVVNHHVADGVSLDTFVDWIAEAGYPIERDADYDRWLQRFEDKLKAMPEDRRQRSSLPLLLSFKAPRKANAEHIGSAAFVEAVRRLPESEVPRLDRTFIQKCLSDMQRLGLIPPPNTPAAQTERVLEAAK